MSSEATEAAPGPPERPSWARRELWAFVELFVLSGFVVAQPLFDVTGRSPDFFVFHRASPAHILQLAAVVVLLPPLGLWAVEALAGLVADRAARMVHLASVTGLLALLALEVAKNVSPLRGKRLVLLAVAAALAVAVLYVRRPALRLWLRFLAPAPLVFALLFATVSPVSALVLPERRGPAGAQVRATTPVVMIIFDEFPLRSLLASGGTIDARLYPNFARLAKGSTWYRNATGVSGLTASAVPALLTGRYPTRPRIPVSSEYPENLFTLLGGSYDLKVSESVTRLCPSNLCQQATGVPRGRTGLGALVKDSAKVWTKIVSPRDVKEDVTTQFAEETVGGAGAAGGTPAQPQVRFGVIVNNKPVRFQDFVGSIRAPSPSAKPPFYFLHVLLPHPPFHYLPSGRGYDFPFDSFGQQTGANWETNGWTNQRWPAKLGEQRHLLQLAYTDALVGQVLDRLKAEGLYDEALVVMTADHGTGFVPGQPRRILSAGNAPGLMWVPLFVKAPHQTAGRVDDRNWEQVDLLPTVAATLGIPVPWPVDGVSQAGPPARQRPEKYFYNAPGQRLVVDGPANLELALLGVTDRLARPQEGPQGLFKVGPHADLVGRRLDRIKVVQAAGRSAVLDHPSAYRQVDPRRGTVPAQVSGEIRTSAPAGGLPMAVALNGTIGGVGETFREGDTPMKFAVMVPDRLFRSGHNQVRLFLVRAAGDGVVLEAVPIEDDGR